MGFVRTFFGLLGVPARLFLGGVFVWAGYKKIFPLDVANPVQVFSNSILAYKLPLPDHMVMFSTFTVPWIEIVVGITLILGLWTRASALVIAGLLGMFIYLGIDALNRGLNINCGCFGDGTLFCKGGLSWCHIRENMFLTSIALFLVLATPLLAVDQFLTKKPAPATPAPSPR